MTKKQIPANAGEREINNYCPSAQLKQMIANCGTQVLSFQQEEHDDSSITLIPVDSNRTKEKIFAQIDSFMEEFVGEDLPRAVIRDINKYLNTIIENEVKLRELK